MRKLLIGILVVIGLLVVAAIALPFLVPRDVIKAQLEQRVSEQLGREFRIEGPLELRSWRPFALSLADVRLANPDWAQNSDLARIASVELDVDALAYLGGTVAIEQLAVTQPVLALEVREDGTPSWQLAAPEGTAADDGPGDGAGGESGGGIPELRIGEIRITEGAVSLDDRSSGEARAFTAIELWVRGDPDGRGLNADGSVSSDGERATLTAAVGDLNGLLAGEPSTLELEAAAPGLGIAANGEAAASGTAVLAISGDMAPRQLLDWLGQPLDLPDGTGETVTFTADIASAANGVAVPALTLNVDDLTIRGNLELATAERPQLSGRLDLGQLDLRPYLPADSGEASDESAETGETSTDTAAEPAAGWPQEPLDLPLPLPLDLDLTVVFAGIETGQVALGAGAIAITADSEEAAVEVTELALYDGSLVGRLALASGDAVDLTLGANGEAIQLERLLADVADLDMLAGSGTLQLDVTSVGTNVDTLMHSLDGEGSLYVRDGAVLGINIGALVRQVMTLGMGGREDVPLRTDFAEAGGTFRITGGRLVNDDFALRAPVLRITGAGTVELGEQRLDYRLEPRVAATLEGQDAAGDSALQAGLPIVITGPWSEPDVQLDLGGALSGDIGDPAALAETLADLAADPAMVQQLGETLGIDAGSAVGDVLEGLSGVLGGQSRADDESDEPSRDPAEQLLEGLGGLLRQ